MNTAADTSIHFAVLNVSGTDAREFLQGQLTCDLRQLTPSQALLGSCNSPQGRVQAVFTLIERKDGIAMILPAAILDATLSRLRKYILRSKVVLRDERQRLPVRLAAKQAVVERGFKPLEAVRMHHEDGGISILRWHDSAQERYLVIGDDAVNMSREISASDWQLADIRAGIPHVFPATHETFTAQMLNLDLLGGISFDKGCYTGQEIIARTHYRGAVKRRMLRFSAACEPPSSGTRVLANDEHAGDVVHSAIVDGGCELLAVVNLANVDTGLSIDTEKRTALQRAPLPYSV